MSGRSPARLGGGSGRCSEPKCRRVRYSGGRCAAHAQRLRRGYSLTTPIRPLKGRARLANYLRVLARRADHESLVR